MKKLLLVSFFLGNYIFAAQAILSGKEIKLLWYLNQLARSIDNRHLTAQEQAEKEVVLEWLSRLNLEQLKRLLSLDDRKQKINNINSLAIKKQT